VDHAFKDSEGRAVRKRGARPRSFESLAGKELQSPVKAGGIYLRSQGTIADQIESFKGALTARQLSELLSISAVSVFKMAKSGRIPCLRIGASVRFCPATIARWLRERGG
jgi:excisionase family DNA binding protein